MACSREATARVEVEVRMERAGAPCESSRQSEARGPHLQRAV